MIQTAQSQLFDLHVLYILSVFLTGVKFAH